MIEYRNQRFPGKSTTECYEYEWCFIKSGMEAGFLKLIDLDFLKI